MTQRSRKRQSTDIGLAADRRVTARTEAMRTQDPDRMPHADGSSPWLQGYARALANVWRSTDDGRTIRRVMIASGFTMDHLESGGADEYDLDAIRDAWSSAVDRS